MSRVTSTCLLAWTFLLAGCKPQAMKDRERVAGDYHWELAGDGWFVSRTLTLRNDGTATMKQEIEAQAMVEGSPPPGQANGTYSVDGITLNTLFKGIGPQQYTIAGDTLFPRFAERDARLQQITGMSANDNLGEQALVRVR